MKNNYLNHEDYTENIKGRLRNKYYKTGTIVRSNVTYRSKVSYGTIDGIIDGFKEVKSHTTIGEFDVLVAKHKALIYYEIKQYDSAELRHHAEKQGQRFFNYFNYLRRDGYTLHFVYAPCDSQHFYHKTKNKICDRLGGDRGRKF